MPPVKKLFKSKKHKWLTFDIYGPIKYRPKKSHKLDTSLSKDRVYTLCIPDRHCQRQWKSAWQGRKVTVVGAYSLFKSGKQVVCVNNSELGDFAAPISWLAEETTLCSCPTDIIWARGCQCGGS